MLSVRKGVFCVLKNNTKNVKRNVIVFKDVFKNKYWEVLGLWDNETKIKNISL